MFAYDFMRTAFAAAGVVAVLSGVVGFFLVLRGQTFAGHALSHVGFTGATGAMLFGLSPLTGMVGFTVLAGFGMGVLGEKLSGRDVAIGMMLSLSLGLGLLFLHFYTAYASQAAALLFGNVLGVSAAALWTLAALAGSASARWRSSPGRCCSLSLQPELAEAKGVPALFRLDRLHDHRRRGRRRMRADRRRLAGLHPDGRTGGGGAKIDDPRRPRRRAGYGAGVGGGVGRTCAGLSDRLADKILDHRPVGARLFWRFGF